MEPDYVTQFLQPTLPFQVLVLLVGACIGSFLTLITYRLPRGEPIGMSRSRCPACQNPLAALDLVPVLSWAFNRGRCRCCKTQISIRYPLTELACALGAWGVASHFGITLEALAITGLWWCIVAIIITDLEHYIILDEVQIAVGLFGALYVFAAGVAWGDAASGAFTGAAIGLALKYGYLYFRNRDGLGMGDVKFLAVAGIWLASSANFVPFLFFSGVMGVASGALWQALKRGEHFPFGPALALSLFACVMMPAAANGFWKLYGLLPYSGS